MSTIRASYTEASASISECGRYRYSLTRRWDHGQTLCIVMLNPSTADGQQDDPTIRRCVGLAASNGFAAIEVVNLFAFRATDKARIVPTGFTIAVGPDNDSAIRDAMYRSIGVALAYGAHAGELGLWVSQRADRIRAIAAECVHALYAFALSKDGHPRHPLYLPGSCRLSQMGNAVSACTAKALCGEVLR